MAYDRFKQVQNDIVIKHLHQEIIDKLIKENNELKEKLKQPQRFIRVGSVVKWGKRTYEAFLVANPEPYCSVVLLNLSSGERFSDPKMIERDDCSNPFNLSEFFLTRSSEVKIIKY